MSARGEKPARHPGRISHPMFDGPNPLPNARQITGRLVGGAQRAPLTSAELEDLGTPRSEHKWLRAEAHRLVDAAEGGQCGPACACCPCDDCDGGRS
jgi:hypothetical protein